MKIQVWATLRSKSRLVYKHVLVTVWKIHNNSMKKSLVTTV